MKKYLKYLFYGLFYVVATYLIAATAVIRISHLEYTETQILIKMFVWGYGE